MTIMAVAVAAIVLVEPLPLADNITTAMNDEKDTFILLAAAGIVAMAVAMAGTVAVVAAVLEVAVAVMTWHWRWLW